MWTISNYIFLLVLTRTMPQLNWVTLKMQWTMFIRGWTHILWNWTRPGSEFLLFASKTQLSKIAIYSISYSGMTINVSQSCRNLGVMQDCNMTMSNQISSTCRSVRYQLRNIGFIRKYLNRSSTEKLVYALISSRLDFGNSILFNLPQTQLSILQRLQNAAAFFIT